MKTIGDKILSFVPLGDRRTVQKFIIQLLSQGICAKSELSTIM